MKRSIKRAVVVSTFALGIGMTGAAPAMAQAPDNWGQEVKACNHLPNCYPGDSNRGTYVQGQAKDGPRGYGQEIHDLANPGNSNPPPFQP
ncbi:hypothetical protein [Micromonospora inositola]|uniref:Uncharacterized protein n=1 Tax=Micromonospora inositola TaxID=47865 RepID=A0A1C5JKD8_9ACTN|nr:hypothetical protein [Micromonospora inositola]SCG71020.1 hypothetical protein GA0070613_4848 [Micromonospora inositola]